MKWMFIVLYIIMICQVTIASDFVIIDPVLIAEDGKDISDFYLGSAFHYNISLLNTGNQSIDTTITVSIFNPTRTKVHNRLYQVTLVPNSSSYLYPYYIYHDKYQDSMVEIVNLDHIGPYEIVISSSNPELIDWIYYKKEGQYRQELFNFSYYTYSMSPYERLMIEKEKEKIKKSDSARLEDIDIVKKSNNLIVISILLNVFVALVIKYGGFRKLWGLSYNHITKYPRVHNWLAKRKAFIIIFLASYLFTLPLFWLFTEYTTIPGNAIGIIFGAPFSILLLFMLPGMFIFITNMGVTGASFLWSYYTSIVTFFAVFLMIDGFAFLSKKYAHIYAKTKKIIQYTSILFGLTGWIGLLFTQNKMYFMFYILTVGIWIEYYFLKKILRKKEK